MRKKKKKKTIIILCVALLILGIAYLSREQVVLWVLKDVFHVSEKKVIAPKTNEYTRNWDYKYVHNTDDFTPKNKEDIRNIYYTFLNSGTTSFSFYCPDSYESCISDVKEFSENKTAIGSLNDYVHPYNEFKHIETGFNKLGKVTLKVNKVYTRSKINKINKEVDRIIKEEIKDEKDVNEQIKIVHDYIINNTKYDSNRSDNKNAEYESNTAYGTLIQGYALCGGYTDAIAIILDRLGIKNFSIESDSHIWNAVYINDAWYHLDLTWDDPVNSDKSDTLQYNFFLITTEELNELKTNYHIYDKKIYQEI